MFVTARVHPGETPASFVSQGLVDWLLGSEDTAVQLRQGATVVVVPMLNPDGVFLGNYRYDPSPPPARPAPPTGVSNTKSPCRYPHSRSTPALHAAIPNLPLPSSPSLPAPLVSHLFPQLLVTRHCIDCM